MHVSATKAFVATWIVQWIVGVIMIWIVVRHIDFAFRSRWVLFVLLLFAQLIWTDLGGLNYTPFRAYMAPFLVTVASLVWKRYKSPSILVFCSIAAVAVSTLCSMEQGIGVSVGMCVYVSLLATWTPSRFPWRAVGVFTVGGAGCFWIALRLGLMRSFLDFASGGYTHPLLPSPSICIALFSYVAAGCLLYRTLQCREVDSTVIPLVSAGCAMLPVALGRSDLLHITAATPAFVVGAASICSMPSIRRVWLTLAFLGIVLVPFLLRRSPDFWSRCLDRIAAVPRDERRDQGKLLESTEHKTVAGGLFVSGTPLTSASLPCDRTYFSPSYKPLPTTPFRLGCLDTGYFLGTADVTTVRAIDEKIEELRQHASEPLLLENTSLEEQFPVQLGDLEGLRGETGTLWVPPQRHRPLTYVGIINFIRAHYVPGAIAGNGALRVWDPVPPPREIKVLRTPPSH